MTFDIYYLLPCGVILNSDEIQMQKLLFLIRKLYKCDCFRLFRVGVASLNIHHALEVIEHFKNPVERLKDPSDWTVKVWHYRMWVMIEFADWRQPPPLAPGAEMLQIPTLKSSNHFAR